MPAKRILIVEDEAVVALDLQVQLEDQRNAWQMQSDGKYVRLQAEEGASEVALEGSHVTLMKRTRVRLRR